MHVWTLIVLRLTLVFGTRQLHKMPGVLYSYLQRRRHKSQLRHSKPRAKKQKILQPAPDSAMQSFVLALQGSSTDKLIRIYLKVVRCTMIWVRYSLRMGKPYFTLARYSPCGGAIRLGCTIG